MWCLECAYLIGTFNIYTYKSLWRFILYTYKVDNKGDITDSDCNAAKDDDEYL